jgi:hypothetical protein
VTFHAVASIHPHSVHFGGVWVSLRAQHSCHDDAINRRTDDFN